MNKVKRAIIVGAGTGTRMLPLTLETPKPLIKVNGARMIDSVIEASENLLERLYEDDLMDITTDIQSLQTTLASKGLLDSDFDI